MNTSNPSDSRETLSRVLEKICEIVEKSADRDYIFRGEPECYPKVSSGLYRQYVEDLGRDTPDMVTIIQEVVIVEMAKEYLRQTDELEILTELQHYGGKTNLIDFTTDYLIALFFACDGSRDRDGRLILLKRESEDYEVRNPANTVKRAGFQKSVFVQAPKGFVEPDNEIAIPKDIKQPILNYLQKYHDISAKHIYSDIHGYIRWLSVHIDAHVEAAKGMIFQQRGSAENNRKKRLKWNKKAILHYTEALKLNPSLFDVYDKRGTIYLDKDDHDRAIQNYNKAIELYPDYAEAYANRGLIPNLIDYSS